MLYVGSKVKSCPEELNPKQSFKNATKKSSKENMFIKKKFQILQKAKKYTASYQSLQKSRALIGSIGQTIYLVEP